MGEVALPEALLGVLGRLIRGYVLGTVSLLPGSEEIGPTKRVEDEPGSRSTQWATDRGLRSKLGVCRQNERLTIRENRGHTHL